MAELRARAEASALEVCGTGRRMVWGEGSLDSPLVIIGEAPGDSEERLGRPFVGRAGKLLDQELARAGIARQSIYITNVVKCRPTLVVGGRVRNRPPLAREAKAWMPYLMEELQIIGPGLLVLMGGTAAKWLIGKEFALTRQRGEWVRGPLGTAAIATFHPAYVLRLQGPAKDEALAALREDLEKVVERLGERGELERIAA